MCIKCLSTCFNANARARAGETYKKVNYETVKCWAFVRKLVIGSLHCPGSVETHLDLNYVVNITFGVQNSSNYVTSCKQLSITITLLNLFSSLQANISQLASLERICRKGN